MDPKKKPVSEETKELGRKFVQALLDEGHDYRSMQDCVRSIVAVLAIGKEDDMLRCARMLGVNPGSIRIWLGIGEIEFVVRGGRVVFLEKQTA